MIVLTADILPKRLAASHLLITLYLSDSVQSFIWSSQRSNIEEEMWQNWWEKQCLIPGEIRLLCQEFPALCTACHSRLVVWPFCWYLHPGKAPSPEAQPVKAQYPAPEKYIKLFCLISPFFKRNTIRCGKMSCNISIPQRDFASDEALTSY